jgi:hypothetical protein
MSKKSVARKSTKFPKLTTNTDREFKLCEALCLPGSIQKRFFKALAGLREDSIYRILGEELSRRPAGMRFIREYVPGQSGC